MATKLRRWWPGLVLSIALPSLTGTCIGRSAVETMRLYDDWTNVTKWDDYEYRKLWPWTGGDPWVSAQTND